MSYSPAVKKGCEIQGGGQSPNSPELSLLKEFPLVYHHSYFLAATLVFTHTVKLENCHHLMFAVFLYIGNMECFYCIMMHTMFLYVKFMHVFLLSSH